MDKLTAIKTFIEIVEQGSFTKAADVLGIPKARVSQRLSDLESELKVTLIHRSTRSLRLTSEGKTYHSESKVILKNLETLESKIELQSQRPQGILRIDSLSLFARYFLSNHLLDFQTQYPDIHIQLSCYNKISHLLEDSIDCSIRGGKLEDSNYIARHLADVRFGLYASREYLNQFGNPTDLESLTTHKVIDCFETLTPTTKWTLSHVNGKNQVVTQPRTTAILDPDVAIAMCINGGGICAAPPFAVYQHVLSGTLIPVLSDWSLDTKPIHLIYHSKSQACARIKCFVDWCVNQFQYSKALELSPTTLATQTRNAVRSH